MTQGAGATGLVRVSVVAGVHRVDVALPRSTPLAELLPELVGHLDRLDGATVHAGHRLLGSAGQPLTPEAGLSSQGVEDGALLTLVSAADDGGDALLRRYDDVVEAMADVAAADAMPWSAVSARRTTLVTGTMSAWFAAAILLTQRGSLAAGVLATATALLLIAIATVLSRREQARGAAVVVAWTGAVHAGVAALVLADVLPPTGPGLMVGGAGLLVGGAIGVVALGPGRLLLAPAVVLGAAGIAAGLVVEATGLDPAVVLTTGVVLAVLASGAFPAAAVASRGTRVDPVLSTADLTATPTHIDPDRVRADAAVARELVLAGTTGVGVLLVVTAPVVATRGRAGALVAVAACLVVLLRARRCRHGVQVLTSVVAGVLGLLAVVVSLMWLHPAWRSGTATGVAVAAGLLLVSTLVPLPSALRREWVADVVEALSLLALLPLLVVATGAFSLVRG